MKNIVFFILSLSLIIGCTKHKTSAIPENDISNTNAIKANIQFSPNRKINRGDTLKITVKTNIIADSIKLYLQDSLISSIRNSKKLLYSWFSGNIKIFGSKNFRAFIYYNGAYSVVQRSIPVLPDFEPKRYTYKINKIYPHDPHAYTQGLIYEDDILYEATGLKGESSLRKVKLETGEILQSYTISSNVFGEGITIWQNKLIQLTWQAHTGFVYDKNSFQKIGEFNYPTEGWGITHDDQFLIMSDGTNILTFLDPNTYAPIKTLQVYDNKGPRTLLNELEYINGKIYANVYTKDFIAIINPQSGAVEAYIDMQGLLKSQDKTRNTDVLNGIAYDKKNNRIFVTGKNWPKLFWISIVSN